MRSSFRLVQLSVLSAFIAIGCARATYQRTGGTPRTDEQTTVEAKAGSEDLITKLDAERRQLGADLTARYRLLLLRNVHSRFWAPELDWLRQYTPEERIDIRNGLERIVENSSRRADLLRKMAATTGIGHVVAPDDVGERALNLLEALLRAESDPPAREVPH